MKDVQEVKKKAARRRKKADEEAKRRKTLRAERRHKEEMLVRAIAAGLVAVVALGGALIYYMAGYAKAASEYNAINASFVMEPAEPWTEPETAVTDTSADAQADTGSNEDSEEAPVLSYPPLTIDHDGLAASNEDYVCWVYIPGCGISYPVVKGSDNDYYLDHTFENKSSSGGAIFMDYRDEPDLFGFNTFLYGHNMKDGSMFGKLKDYANDETLIETFPYFYVYTRDGFVRKYRIFSYYTTDGNAACYDRPEDEDGKTAYLKFVRTHAAVQGLPYTGDYGCYMTLSTCHGAPGSGGRFLVHGVLTDMISMEE